MLLPASRFIQIYSAVKQDKHASEDRAVIAFVANGDVDSLCAYAQLESILAKSDMVISCIPVENYEEVQEYCKKEHLGETEDLKTVFMINCGATDNVRQICELSDNVRLIIIDSHRPIWHGYNIEEDQNTLVVLDDDDPVPKQDMPEYRDEDGDLEGGVLRDRDNLEASSSSEEEEDEDDDEGGSGDEEAAALQRETADPVLVTAEDGTPMWQNQGAGVSGRAQGGASGSGAEGDRQGRGRKRRAEASAELLRHNQAVEDYYQFKAGYGKPTALLLFQLAHSLQLEDNFHIWLAILGVTDQFILQRVDPLQYTQWRLELENHVAQHNIEEEPEENIEQYGNNRHKHRPTVVRIEGLRLAFLKKWTLSSSMLYNHHVATRFQTWREAGKKQVDFLLSKLNIRVEQHQADYTSMHPAVEPRLREKLPQTVATFGLNWEMLKYDGFELHYKNEIKLSAMDHVLAITAMLGRPRKEGLSSSDVFWDAIKCLNPCGQKDGTLLLGRGIERAKNIAVQIVEQGGLALTRKQVQGQRGFWYLDLANLNFTGHHEFHHHSTLLKLAIFLRDANAQRMKSTAGLLVVGPPNQNDDCYIVTVREKHQAGIMQSNPFAMPLLEALKDCGAASGYMQATFDSSIFVIKKHLVTAFCEEMRAVVSAYQTCGAAAND